MAHAIFVGDITGSGIKNMALLAYAIPSMKDAERLVQRLAGSYPEHGLEPSTGVYWFRDKQGMHEIWAWPVE